jgi:hypothetical protein
VLASISLGLCIASNHAGSFVVVGTGLAYVLAVLMVPRVAPGASAGERTPERGPWWERLVVAGTLIVTGPAVAAGILSPYLRSMLAETTYIGFHSSPVDSVRDVLNAVFFHGVSAPTSGRDIHTTPDLLFPGHPMQMWMAEVGAEWLTALLVPFIVALIVMGVARIAARPNENDALPGALWICGVALGTNWELFEIAHHARDVPYPNDRLLLIVVMLILVGACAMVFSLQSPIVRWVTGLAMLGLLGATLLRTDLRYTRSWRFDAGINEFVSYMRSHPAGSSQRKTSVGGSWIYDGCFEFYRVSQDDAWLAPYRDNAPPDDPALDYYIYHPSDGYPREPRGFRKVMEDPLSGACLGRRN